MERGIKNPHVYVELFPHLGKSISFVCVPSESQKIMNNYKEKVSNWEVCIVRIISSTSEVPKRQPMNVSLK